MEVREWADEWFGKWGTTMCGCGQVLLGYCVLTNGCERVTLHV